MFALTGCASDSGSSGGSVPSGATSPVEPAASTDGQSATTQAVEPELLSVGKADIASGLKPEGLRDGKINPLAGEVIWYTGADRVAPGETGTAVVAGHVANGKKPDAFAKLDQVKVGDTFSIVMSNGQSVPFKVKRAAVVDKTALTHDQDVWGANTSTARVALITCDSDLGYRSDGHRKANFVVIGDKVSG